MKSFFEANTYTEILVRFDHLTPDTKPLWGTMTPSQMMAHCSAAFENALSKEKTKRAFLGLLFGKWVKKSFTNNKPIKKNLPTAPHFKITDQRNFITEKTKLLGLMEKFHKGGPNGVTKNSHTFFGKMTSEEWDKLMTKHIDHHLQQFGV